MNEVVRSTDSQADCSRIYANCLIGYRPPLPVPWKPHTGITDLANPDKRLIAYFEWTGPRINPTTKGIYQVANLSSYTYGYGYGVWTGSRWGRFRNFGGPDDSGHADLWRGPSGHRRQPFVDKDVR